MRPAFMIGGLNLSSRALLAPLEGVSDAGFRAVAHSQGASLTFTEMVRASALIRGNAAAASLLDSHDASTPTGVQLLVTSPDEVTRALDRIKHEAEGAYPHWRNLCCVDLNFGCPSPAVIRDGAGPAMLKRRSRVRAIFRALSHWRDKNHVATSGPGRTFSPLAVGVKLRLGLTAREASVGVYVDTCRAAADEGLDWVTLHARHAGQRSRDEPDWAAFGAAARALDSNGSSRRPKLVANGNIFDRTAADSLIDSGVADGVMIARGAITSPWIFRELAGGTSRSFFSPEDVELARSLWQRLSMSTPGGRRDKYVEWHTASWERLANHALGRGTASPTQAALPLAPLPANEHLS
jgi:tRNA-dihydrouridine synthase